MNKREFIKSSVLAGMGISVLGFESKGRKREKRLGKIKHWVWENPNKKETELELHNKYKDFFSA